MTRIKLEYLSEGGIAHVEAETVDLETVYVIVNGDKWKLNELIDVAIIKCEGY